MLSFGFDLSRSGYDAERADQFMRTLADRLSRTPGISGAAFSFQPLLSGNGWGMGFTVEGHQPPPGEDNGARVNAVSPGFFAAVGIPLVAGREFSFEDGRATALREGWPYTVAVVDETFVKWYVKNGNPIGRRIGFGSNPGTAMPIEIVGVARNSHYYGLREKEFPTVYVPYLQATIESATAYVRTEQDPYAVLRSIRREMAAMDSQVALYDVTTLEERVAQSIVNERMIASLSTTLAVMATLLAIMGLYGVMAYSVTRRTREIGIRMALGALTRQIAAGVLKEAVVLIGVGLTLGLGAAWSLGKYIESQLYGVPPWEVRTMTLAVLTLATVALAAAMLPARRAAGVSPMTALREE
jgi:predicted permease